MIQKLLEMIQVTVLFNTFPPLIIHFNLLLYGKGRQNCTLGPKTAPGAPKLGYKSGQASQLIARGGPAWAVICS